MDETQYHTLANAALERWFAQLEEAYDQGQIDELELEGGILTIKTPSRRTFLISKHAPSTQIWYASPVSGGLHFRFDAPTQGWTLPDGRTLPAVVTDELVREGINVSL